MQVMLKLEIKCDGADLESVQEGIRSALEIFVDKDLTFANAALPDGEYGDIEIISFEVE